MSFFKNNFWFKRIAILTSVLIISLILWNTYMFFQKFKEDERKKMKLFASALKELNENKDLNADFSLESKIIENTNNIPLILTDAKGNIEEWHNLDSLKAKNKDYLVEQLASMKSQNKPIEVTHKDIDKRFIYYRNSDLLYKLTYYPIALLLILGLFLTVVYLFFTSNKIAEQNKLWTGMAKETAHQIGTPLSSLMGWTTILKGENINQDYVAEIEKDVNRLSIIANRFSKIGSTAKLQQENIVAITKSVFDYLQSRSSKQISFSFSTSQNKIIANTNKELFGWVIENIIKNAVDAMQRQGALSVVINNTNSKISITVSDTGKGIAKSNFQQIFTPGFTTKKRGWGLGLSLSKRIIEDYHKGKIFVQKSEIGRGTTFEILLDKV